MRWNAGLVSSSEHGGCTPAGGYGAFVQMDDARANALRRAGVRLAGQAHGEPRFSWSAPGTHHLLLGAVSGSSFIEAAGRRHELSPGEVIVVPAGVARRFCAGDEHWRMVVVSLRDRAQWRHLCRRDLHRPVDRWLGRILTPIEGLLAEQTPRPEGEDAFSLYARILQRQLEAMLAPQAVRPHDGADTGLQRLWRRVSEDPAHPWDAESMAAAVGVSRTTLYRLVKRDYGDAPARLVERIRMDAACRLLAESHASIEMIADQVGYASAFSLSSAFKRAVGEPPSAFRKRAREGTNA